MGSNSSIKTKEIREIDLDTNQLDLRQKRESIPSKLRRRKDDWPVQSERKTLRTRLKDRRTRKKAKRRRFLRYRIVPKSILATASFLLAIAIGIAFAGASFYAFYNSRLSENEQAVGRFVDGFDQQFNNAAGALDELRESSVDQIRNELVPLDNFVANANGVVDLPAVVGDSVWLLETRNSDGEVLIGSAFAVAGHQGGTAFLTSFSVVRDNARLPAPGIELVNESETIEAELWSWDEASDLALVVVDEAVEPLDFATNSVQVDNLGQTVFAISGVGGNGATAVPGVMVDSSRSGIQHTAPVGTLFEGGPLVDGAGRVLGLSSTGFRPYGIDPGQVGQSVDVQIICAQILRCSETDGILAAEVGGVAQERLVQEDVADDVDADGTIDSEDTEIDSEVETSDNEDS